MSAYNNGIFSNGTTTASSSAAQIVIPSYININNYFSIDCKYYLLGEEFSGKKNDDISLIISLININGIEFYYSLKKNNYNFDCFPTKIIEFLENNLKSLERNKKIEDVLI